MTIYIMLLNKIVKTPIYNIVKKKSLDYCPLISKNLKETICFSIR